MSSLKTLNSEADLETLNVHREMFTLYALTSEVDKREAIIPQQRYEQEMEGIWEKVNQLPEGQDKVVLSQIWECGKTTPSPTPKNFPALATCGRSTCMGTFYPLPEGFLAYWYSCLEC